MTDRGARARVLPFVMYMAFVAVADGLARLGVAAAPLRWLYGVKVLAVLLVLWFYRSEYRELTGARPGWRGWLAAVLVGVLVLVLWLHLDASWMVVGTSAGFDPRTGGAIDWGLVVVRIAGAALIVPLMEELFWRSFLMRWLQQPAFQAVDPRQVQLKAFVVTALLFGIEHNLWLAGVVAGAAYAGLYMVSRSLWTAIAAHAVTNGLLGVWIVLTQQWTYW